MLDGATSAPGGIDGVGAQVGRQFAEIAAISAYSFTVSCILLLILKYIPGMHLRVTEEAEMIGLDIDQFFDEQIGDWSMLEHLEARSLDKSEGPSSGAVSVKHEDPVLGKTDSSLATQ
jgi:ammonium transporter, Amt family